MIRLAKFRIELVCAVSIVSLAALAACGGTSPSAATPGDETTGASAPPPASEAAAETPAAGDVTAKSFDDMTPPERMELMKKKVIPEMTAAFQSFDSNEFEKVSCATCHGPGAKNGEFEMPTKSLPALDKAEMDKHPEMTKFMMEVVVPKMAGILGEHPYDPETHEGFGCFNCHTKKE